MSHYVRIELHNAVAKDYDALHGYMAAEKFGATVPGKEGEFLLPPGTYYSTSFASSQKAMDAAGRAASRTKKEHSILVTNGPAKWRGLKKKR